MRLRHVFLLILILAGLVTSSQHGSAAGQSPAPVAAAAIPRLEHTTFTLANGLKVIFSQDKRLPMVAVNLWYHVGPANEIPGRTGFAIAPATLSVRRPTRSIVLDAGAGGTTASGGGAIGVAPARI